MTRLAVALCLAAFPAQAQDDALTATIARALAPAADPESVAEPLECAALFRALSAVFGPETETGAGFVAREGYMASVAAMLRATGAESGAADPDAIFAALVPPLDAATAAFLDHMEQLAGDTGTPFDDAILSRTEVCIALHDALAEG